MKTVPGRQCQEDSADEEKLRLIRETGTAPPRLLIIKIETI